MKKREITSSISSLVQIWKIGHSGPGCSFVWILRVVYFPVNTCVYIINHGYASPMKIMGPRLPHAYSNQFFKPAKGLGDFACVRVWVKFCFTWLLLLLSLLVKTRLNFFVLNLTFIHFLGETRKRQPSYKVSCILILFFNGILLVK